MGVRCEGVRQLLNGAQHAYVTDPLDLTAGAARLELVPEPARVSVRERVDRVPLWWHSIDLGDGVVTPGFKTPAVLDTELSNLCPDDFRGKTVLDVGAWDGYFSFAAERYGAERVVALDHYVWSTDLRAYESYRATRAARQQQVAPAYETEFWHPGTLPGRAGFDLAHEALASSVEPIVADLMDCDLHAVGTFDVVLYLGVLYHMRHPLLALERAAAVVRPGGYVLIETLAESCRLSGRRTMGRFIEGAEINGDQTNWWVFNEPALKAMCRAAGFRGVEILRAPPRWQQLALAAVRGTAPFRAVLRAWR